MFNVGGGEILVILVLGLIVLGPDKLPETARAIGKHLSTFKRMRDGFQNELRTAMDPLQQVVSTVTKPSAATPAERGASAAERGASAATTEPTPSVDPVQVAGPAGSFQ